ncbi:MAG TPA: hypothetical protein VMS22_15250 [Candidatus Eisenbacteria bacterium]|nr:hypothetical protein [Candidatus Eisenbacteria bacterium]
MSRTTIALASLLVASLARASGRCNEGQLAGGLQCGCPDVRAQIQAGLVSCPSGYVPVVYDLGQPFAPDATTSTLTMRASVRSQCPTLERTVGVTGHLVVCWGPPEGDCRQMVVPYNSFCIDTEDTTLGAACNGACQDVSTSIIAIMNAGAAHFRVCPPNDPATSCRSTSPGGVEIFRFQPGGFCVTEECDGAAPGPDTCVGGWGATYLGFGRHQTQRGWYDWPSGAFKVDYRGHRPVCGALGACIGDRGHWTGTFVATPSPTSPNLPPCLSAAGDVCNPTACTP